MFDLLALNVMQQLRGKSVEVYFTGGNPDHCLRREIMIYMGILLRAGFILGQLLKPGKNILYKLIGTTFLLLLRQDIVLVSAL